MFSIWKAVASRGRDEMTMSRSSLRIRCTQSMVVVALPAGSTVKTWPHLFLTKRASFARRPASAAATGDDSRPAVETLLKSTVQGTTHSRTRHGMSVYAGPEAASAVKPWECEVGTACLIDDALAVLDESGVGIGPLLQGLRAARPVAEAAASRPSWRCSAPRGRCRSLPATPAKSALSPIAGAVGWCSIKSLTRCVLCQASPNC